MVIHFTYPRGRMTVNLEKFLPTNQKKVRKLFRLMVPHITPVKRLEVERYLETRTEDGRYQEKYRKFLEIFQEEEEKYD